MPPAAVRAFAEGGAHFRRAVRGKELHIPFLLDAASQQVQVKVLVPQALPNADNPLYRTVLVVYPVFLCILHQPQDERRHTHDGVRFQALDGVPLQFRDAVAHADNAGAQLPDAQKIGQAGHKALVNGGHELDNVPGFYTGAGKALFFVIGKPLQVFLRAAKGNRVSQCSGSGHIVHHLGLGAAQEFLVKKLQILLFRKGDLLQVLDGPDFVNVYMVFLKHPLIIARMPLKVLQRLLQQPLLKYLDLFRRLEFNICHIGLSCQTNFSSCHTERSERIS